MAIAAIEAIPTGARAPVISHVHLVGVFPTVVDWALAAYLGGPLEVSSRSGDGAGLAAAVGAACEGKSDQGSLVIAVDRDGPQGALAVALQFGRNPAAQAPTWGTMPAGEGAAAIARVGLAKVGIVADPSRGGPAPAAPWVSDRAEGLASLTPSQVSEGAYVPQPRYVENLPSRWRLEGDRCARCERTTFPRRARCRYCGQADRLSPLTLSRDGARVVAATAICKGGQPTEFDPQVEGLGGYGVVMAEFERGVRLTLQVTDSGPGEVRIGDRVGTRLRRLYPMEGEWRYGRKAIPLPPDRTA